MSVDTLTVEDIIYRIVNGSAELKAEITGDVYRKRRPTKSTAEDIVIGASSILEGSNQLAVANVNVYVPNIFLTTGEDSVADDVRFEAISKILLPIIEEVYGDNYNFWVSMSTQIEDERTGQYYMNYRLTFRYDNSI